MALPKLLQKLFQNNGAGDKLNQDIIPDIPYSKVTGAPSVDSALSSTSENPVQNKVINSALDGKLSTSGGTMTGDIIFSNSATKIASAQNTGGKVEVSQIGAGLWGNQEDYQGGATLLLRSSTYLEGQEGMFYLISALSPSQRYDLVGTPNGSLTWGGHNVISVVAESYSANGWYRKYSDGWIEQGGYLSSTKKTVSFLTAFNGVPIVIGVVDCATATSSRTGMIQICSVTTSSFYMRGWATSGGRVSDDPGWWYACGK